MFFQRFFALAVAAMAALALSGCFVVSKNLPAGSGPINDDRLVGDWRVLHSDSGDEEDVYMHIQKPDPAKPLRLVWVENNDYQIYDITTLRIGTKNVFAAKRVASTEKNADKQPAGYFLGFYEARESEISFRMFDSEKVGALIAKHAVKGTQPPGKYEIATLTGSPDELARFLASPQADAAQVDETSRLRRLPPGGRK